MQQETMTLVLSVCSYLIINAYLSHYVYPTIHVGAIGSLLHLGSYITPVMYIYCAVSQQYTFTLPKIRVSALTLFCQDKLWL